MFKIGYDKILHLVVCFATSLFHPMLAIGLAVGKEYGDSKSPVNKWSWEDIFYDVIGIASGGTIHYLVLWFVLKSMHT